MNAFVDLLTRRRAQSVSCSLIATTSHKDGSVSADVQTFMASSRGQRELTRAQEAWERHHTPLAL